MNEGIVCSAIKQTVMEAIDEGILIDECWMDGTSQEAIEQALEDTAGSAEERLLTSQILHLALTEPHEYAMNLRIEAKGTPEDR